MERDNKKKLLAAAIALFSEYGYDKISIRDIAQKAKVNSAMISYYFGSKQQLYDSALEKQAGELRTFNSSKTLKLAPREILRLYADTLQKIHNTNPTLMKFICWEFLIPSNHPETFIKQRLQQVYSLLIQAIATGVKEGIFRKNLDIHSTVIALVGIINFYYISRNLHMRVSCIKDDDEKYMHNAMEIFFSGIERKSQ
ncbi:MAG: TetR family transcriptional regulator [Acidaminococcaceae bacterium]|nr:TetR family transcriptional regulator [Acidaminococcaceae bacterium]MDD4722996.1 TetR family transcriptional regulator [Acidaminococcaceae bacterium]